MLLSVLALHLENAFNVIICIGVAIAFNSKLSATLYDKQKLYSLVTLLKCDNIKNCNKTFKAMQCNKLDLHKFVTSCCNYI